MLSGNPSKSPLRPKHARDCTWCVHRAPPKQQEQQAHRSMTKRSFMTMLENMDRPPTKLYSTLVPWLEQRERMRWRMLTISDDLFDKSFNNAVLLCISDIYSSSIQDRDTDCQESPLLEEKEASSSPQTVPVPFGDQL